MKCLEFGYQSVIGNTKGVGECVGATLLLCAPEPTGGTKILAGAGYVRGADNVLAGVAQVFSGEDQKTVLNQGIEKGLSTAGVDEFVADEVADTLEDDVDLVLAAGEFGMAVRTFLRAKILLPQDIKGQQFKQMWFISQMRG